MAITVAERFESRRTTGGESTSKELLYWIEGTNDDVAAESALLSAAPLLYGLLVYKTHELEHGEAENLWYGSVRYGKFKKEEEKETGDSSYSFNTGGGTQQITQSIDTISSHAPPGENAPDFNGAIGVTTDSVEGVDITVPVFNFEETHIIDDADVTAAYKAALFARTGQTNDDTFKGFAAGEVLFLGASGSKRGEEDWEINFRFAASPNVNGLAIGDIVNVSKKGWEYLWIRYADEADDVAKVLVKTPIACYVEKVYYDGDFADLGIGT